MDELLQQPEFEKRALLFLNEVEDYASQKNILVTGSIEDDWEEDEEGDDYEAPKTLVTVNNLTTQWISFRSMFEQLAQDSDPDLADEGKEYLQISDQEDKASTERHTIGVSIISPTKEELDRIIKDILVIANRFVGVPVAEDLNTIQTHLRLDGLTVYSIQVRFEFE